MENTKSQPQSGLLSFDEWNDYFRNGADFECDALLFDESRPLPAETLESHCWTLVDTENGLFIVDGKRLVNRIGYLVTEQPHDGVLYEVDYEERECVVWDQPSNDVLCMRNFRVLGSHEAIVACRNEGTFSCVLRDADGSMCSPPGLPSVSVMGNRVVLIFKPEGQIGRNVVDAFGPYSADMAALAAVGNAMVKDEETWREFEVKPFAKLPDTVRMEHTDDKTSIVYLSDRFGDWIPGESEALHPIMTRFPDDQIVEGDPRNYLFGEVGMVIQRDNAIGIQFEFETGYYLGSAVNDPATRTNIEQRSRTNEFACDERTYYARVAEWRMRAEKLKAAWPTLDVYLADGYSFFDDCLTVCIFVALTGNAESGFKWPVELGTATPERVVNSLHDVCLDPAKYGDELRGTHACADQSISEGWGIWCVETPTGSALRIQRYDEANKFIDDESAIAHVRLQARAGSDLHQRAVRMHEGDRLDMPSEKEISTNSALPADPEKMNDERATFAGVAVDAFIAHTRTEPEDALSDLLCNLRHWSDRNNFDFDAELERAQRNYAEAVSDGQ